MCMGFSQQRLAVQELKADEGIPKTTVSEISTQNFGMKHHHKILSVVSATRAKKHGAAVADDLIRTATSEPDFL